MRPGEWGMSMQIPKGFMDYGILQHEVLAAAAEQGCNLIKDRVSRGIGMDDAPLAPYKRSVRIERDENGKIVRNAKGQWTEHVVRQPGDVVNLRSRTGDVPEGRHMMDNVKFSPAFPTASDKVVWINLQGSRTRKTVDRSGAVKTESIPHSARGTFTQRGGHKEKPQREVIPRPWLGLSPNDKRGIFDLLRSVPPIAWLDTHRKAAVESYISRAIAARRGMIKAMIARDEAKVKSAERRYRKMMAALGPEWNDEKIVSMPTQRKRRKAKAPRTGQGER